MFFRRNRFRLKHGKNLVIIYWIFFCFFLFFIACALFSFQKYQQAKMLAAEKQVLTKIIKSYAPIQISVSVINLSIGQSFSVGSSHPFIAASTSKIILAACLLHEVEIGKKSLSAQVGEYQANFQLQQMVQESNNDSWHAITNYVGLQTLSDYAQSIGIHYDVSNNTIATQDEALFLQKLYTGTLLNTQDTKLLLSFMQNTNENTLIPASVPADVTVYHKYGWLDNYIHDAAILIYHNKLVILVIYTKGSTTTANKQIQLFKPITKAVLNYELGVD